MNRTITSAAAIMAVLVSAGAASADEANNRGFYLSGSAGVSILQNADLKAAGVTLNSEFDKGVYLSGALGYHVMPNIRVEGEFAYRNNDLNKIAGISIDSSGNAYSLMANGYYDFNNSSMVTPYIGAGLGATHLSIDNLTVGGTNFGSSSDTVFSYQGIAGLAFNVMPNTKLGLEYKYLGTTNPNFDGVKAEYKDHAIGVKLTYNF